MAYKIGDNCIMCGSCAGNCPVGAISEGDDCILCGLCGKNCPVGAIDME